MAENPETGLDEVTTESVDLLRDELRSFVSGNSQLLQTDLLQSQSQMDQIDGHTSHTNQGGGGGGGGGDDDGWC